jgi:uncharacterized protein YciI
MHTLPIFSFALMLRAVCRPALLSATAAQRCAPSIGRVPTRLATLSTRPQPPAQSSRGMAAKTAPAAGGAADAPPPPPPPPTTFTLLSYAYVPDILEKRGPYRADHIAAAKAQVAAGRMVMAGATGDPVSGALFVWAPGVPAAEVEAFAAGDPYVQAGLVPAWKVEPYMVVAQAP